MALVVPAATGCGENSANEIIFGRDEITVGGKKIMVDLAITGPQKSRGLKYRRKLAADRGMLFIYSHSTRSPFWMKDTHIPLSIAFIDGRKRIIGIEQMLPDNDEKIYSPPGPFLYALEMNQGWFERNNVKVGDQVIIK